MKKSMDPIWEQIHSEREWGQYPSEHIIRFVAANYYKMERSNIRILDFGCGQGAHTWYLAREGFDTYAFDGSESAVRKTKKKLEQEKLMARLEVMDGKEIDYLSNFFNAVIDSACVCSNRLNDIKSMYREIYRVLVPGGKLLTTSFSVETTGYGEGDFVEPGTYMNIKRGPLQGVTTHFWEKNELEMILRETGFQDLEMGFDNYTLRGSNVTLNIISATK